MKTLIVFVVLLAVFRAFADEIKGSSGSSAADAFITSDANARGVLLAGVKTVHAVVPLAGFGNTINPTNGNISTDPALHWTYTKRTETVSWTTNQNVNPFRGNSMQVKQAISISDNLTCGATWNDPDGTCSSTNSSGAANIGYITGTLCCTAARPGPYCYFDVSACTAWPTNPTPSTFSTNMTQVVKFHQFYTTNGYVLSVDSSTAGSIDSTSWSSFDPYNYLGFATPGYQTNQPFAEGVDLVNFYLASTNVSGATVTFTSSLQEQDSIASVLYWNVFPCIGGGAMGNVLYGTTFSYTFTHTYSYSDPVSVDDVSLAADNLVLTNVNLNDKSVWYYCFDTTNIATVVQWNPVIVPGATLMTTTLKRAPVDGGTIGTFTTLRNNTTGLPFSNTPSFYDTGTVPFSNYVYSLSVTYFGGGGAGPFSTTNAIMSTTPASQCMTIPPDYIYTNQPKTNVNLNLSSTPQWFKMSWGTMATATNSSANIAVYPVTNGVVYSTNVSTPKPTPLYLAAHGEPVGAGMVTFGTPFGYAPTNFYSSKSFAFLTGNSPSNSPPGTNYKQQLIFTNAPALGVGTNDLTSTLGPLQFPRGRFGGYAWQLSGKMEFWPTNCPTNGFLFYQ